MNKKLFTQIRNEWRSNLWLALELLVVSVVMWYIIDLLYCRLATYMEPRGFDTEHCYLITMGVLTDKSPDYTDRRSARAGGTPAPPPRGGSCQPVAKFLSL